MAPTVPSPSIPCYLSTTTNQIYCGAKPDILKQLSPLPVSDLIELHCDNLPPADAVFNIVEPQPDELHHDAVFTIQTRAANPEPEPEPGFVDEPRPLVKRAPMPQKSRPKGGSTNTGSNAAGRVVVSGLAVWVALGWVVGSVL